MALQVGDRVFLTTNVGDKWEPQSLQGLHGRFLGFDKRGYARVLFDDYRTVELVHLESLHLENP